MGLLNLLTKPATLNLVRLPNGSFTVDATGKVLTSTLSQSFPEAWVEQIGRQIVTAFHSAQAAQMPLGELHAEFSALKLTARALRGGAIIFLAPQGPGRKSI
jgi:hypothetical protein